MQQLSGGVRTLLATWILFFYFKQKISQQFIFFTAIYTIYGVFAAFITVG